MEPRRRPPTRRVRTYTFELRGRRITRQVVRCPGKCRGWAGFERLADGEARIESHGGGLLGLQSCNGSWRRVILREEGR